MNQKEQEPVAWAMLHDNGQFIDAIHPEEHARVEGDYTHPLYTHPQPKAEKQEPDDLTIAYMSGFHDGKKKREWVGLTDDELNILGDRMQAWNSNSLKDIYIAIEAKLKEKNT